MSAIRMIGVATAGLLLSPMLTSTAQAVDTRPEIAATSPSERSGCGGYSKIANGGVYFEQSVMRGSTYFPQHGKIKIYEAGSGSKSRFCALLLVNKREKLTLQVGTRKQGSTSNPVTWSKNSNYYDAGTYSTYAGGLAITPSPGRCAAVYGTATVNGVKYTRKLTYNLCN